MRTGFWPNQALFQPSGLSVAACSCICLCCSSPEAAPHLGTGNNRCGIQPEFPRMRLANNGIFITILETRSTELRVHRVCAFHKLGRTICSLLGLELPVAASSCWVSLGLWPRHPSHHLCCKMGCHSACLYVPLCVGSSSPFSPTGTRQVEHALNPTDLTSGGVHEYTEALRSHP